MIKKVVLSLVILLLGAGVAFFVFKTEPKLNKNFETQNAFFKKFPFRLGLDLSGGSHLVYKADVSAVPSSEVENSMDALRDVIERRINIFGVSEPIVQAQHGGFISGSSEKLIVDLPGVTDVKKAVEMIGQTPVLEFKTQAPDGAPQNATVDKDGKVTLDLNSQFVATELTGRYLKKATLEFDQNTREPRVSLQFDDTGTKLFAKITKENVGKMVAIYLDGSPVSTPVVNEEIPNGQAVISGNFTPQEAKLLVGRLNSGALPVPITLVSTQVIGAPLGAKALGDGIYAGLIGLLAIAIFLIVWYRLPGVVAVLALTIYVMIMLLVFKLIPITLTAAGIAGFILSIGMAVDANILIAERTKEELRRGKDISTSINEGFARAWLSIRDSNISSIITGIILFWFGSSLIEGFALTFVLGVLVSMFSAITVTRTFLKSLGIEKRTAFTSFIFSSGFHKN